MARELGDRTELVATLPLYAAPVGEHAPAAVRIERRWAPAVRTIERGLPWLDWAEARARTLQVHWQRCAVPVSRSNAPVALRVGMPAAALEHALIALAAPTGEASFGGDGAAGGPCLRLGPDLRGRLELRWCRPVEVALSARPWSSERSDLVLAPGARRRIRYPRRWFDAGFVVLAELRREILQAAGLGGR